MRYFSSNEYFSPIRKVDTTKCSINVLNALNARATLTEFKKTTPFLTLSINKEIKELKNYYHGFSSEQFELSSDDYFEKLRILENKIDVLKAKDQSYYNDCLDTKKLLSEADKDEFKYMIQLGNKIHRETYEIVSKSIKQISDDLIDILYLWLSESQWTLMQYKKDNNLRYCHESIIDNEFYKNNKRHYVDENNLAQDFFYYGNNHRLNNLTCDRDSLFKMPLSELIELFKFIQPLFEKFNDIELETKIAELKLTSEKKCFRKMIGIELKATIIINNYEIIKMNDDNYKMLVIK